ncbi:hypothetical protein IAU59_001168 [Kwoniella sp. CBS 9459]
METDTERDTNPSQDEGTDHGDNLVPSRRPVLAGSITRSASAVPTTNSNAYSTSTDRTAHQSTFAATNSHTPTSATVHGNDARGQATDGETEKGSTALDSESKNALRKKGDVCVGSQALCTCTDEERAERQAREVDERRTQSAVTVPTLNSMGVRGRGRINGRPALHRRHMDSFFEVIGNRMSAEDFLIQLATRDSSDSE